MAKSPVLRQGTRSISSFSRNQSGLAILRMKTWRACLCHNRRVEDCGAPFTLPEASPAEDSLSYPLLRLLLRPLVRMESVLDPFPYGYPPHSPFRFSFSLVDSWFLFASTGAEGLVGGRLARQKAPRNSRHSSVLRLSEVNSRRNPTPALEMLPTPSYSFARCLKKNKILCHQVAVFHM
jgi:hypothetical protein